MEYIALAGSVLTAISSIVAVVISNKNSTAILNIKLEELEKRISQKSSDNMRLIATQIDTLEKKQDKHNNLMDRMYKLEKDCQATHEVIGEKLKVANHRIEDLEELRKEKII